MPRVLTIFMEGQQQLWWHQPEDLISFIEAAGSLEAAVWLRSCIWRVQVQQLRQQGPADLTSFINKALWLRP